MNTNPVNDFRPYRQLAKNHFTYTQQYLCARCGHPKSDHPCRGCVAFCEENMLEEEDVTINHWLKFDRPHIYKCSCGYVQVIFPIGDSNSYQILERPKNKVEYMPCGHATCARRVDGNNEYCIICGDTK